MVDFETIKQKIEKSEAINREIVPDIVALLRQDIVGNSHVANDLLRLCDEKADKWYRILQEKWDRGDKETIKPLKIRKDSSSSYKKNIRKYIMRYITKVIKSREFRNCTTWSSLSRLARSEVELIYSIASLEQICREIKLMSDDDFQKISNKVIL